MNILLTIRGLRKREGGPSYTAPALAKALAARGHRVDLLADAHDIDAPEGVQILNRPSLHQPLAELISQYEIVHDNGAWLPFNHAIAKAARHAKVPRVISPRGSLQPWILKQRRLKKAVGWLLYQRRDLLQASGIFATADIEAESVRKLGYQGPIFLLPNGVDQPGPLPILPGTARHPRKALFLSRLHPKKGVVDLVEAWMLLRPAGWELILAGPDEADLRPRLETKIREAGLSASIRFVGPLYGPDKATAFQEASLFVLPTYSENFGVSVVEAMLMEVPVLTTTETPWAELESSKLGWIIPPGRDPILEALKHIFTLPEEELRRRGKASRVWSSEKFEWNTLATQAEDHYRQILQFSSGATP